MPRLSAAPITLTPEQEADLRGLARAHKTPRKLAERAEMILRSAAGTEVREIARQLCVWPKTVRHWRSRWLAGQAEAAAAARLADEPRLGAPATFTPEQICAIVALACEPPEKSELPLSHWSQSELAREAVRRGIVDNISHGSVGRFLKKRPTSNHISCAAGSRPSRTLSSRANAPRFARSIMRRPRRRSRTFARFRSMK